MEVDMDDVLRCVGQQSLELWVVRKRLAESELLIRTLRAGVAAPSSATPAPATDSVAGDAGGMTG